MRSEEDDLKCLFSEYKWSGSVVSVKRARKKTFGCVNVVRVGLKVEFRGQLWDRKEKKLGTLFQVLWREAWGAKNK